MTTTTDRTLTTDPGTVRNLAHDICRQIPEGPGCVMDERPYRGDCNYQNCRVMCEVRDLLLRLAL